MFAAKTILKKKWFLFRRLKKANYFYHVTLHIEIKKYVT